MSTMDQPGIISAEYGQLLKWCNGHEDAASLVYTLGQISQLGDDLADTELKIPPEAAVVNLLLGTLVHVPGNRFFQENIHWYLPVFFNALISWELSDELAKSSSRESRMFAFVLRESLEQVIYVTALLTGGVYHARQVAREVHEYYHGGPDRETFEAWEKDHESRRQPRPTSSTASPKHH